MQISKSMNLGELSGLIADTATEADAAIVRDELIKRGCEAMDTKDVDDQTWFECAYQVPTAA